MSVRPAIERAFLCISGSQVNYLPCGRRMAAQNGAFILETAMSRVITFLALTIMYFFSAQVGAFQTSVPSNAVTVHWANYGAPFTAQFWQADDALWGYFPAAPTAFICGPGFKLVQNGSQYDTNLEDANGNSFCGQLYTSVILKFTAEFGSNGYINASHGLSIYYGEDYSSRSVSLGEAPWAATSTTQTTTPTSSDPGPLAYIDKISLIKVKCQAGGKTRRATQISDKDSMAGISCSPLNAPHGKRVVITIIGTVP